MRRTRLNPESTKHRRDRALRRSVVEQAWDRDQHCQFPGCHEIRDLEAHEIIPRSAWAKGYLVLDNVAMLCRPHHQRVTDNPAEAHALGLHRFSWERTMP